jgi:hypothetical protein
LLNAAFAELPPSGHLQVVTIPGIGDASAAVLVAKIVDIERFATPQNLVSYFGILPEENTSGVDKQGNPVPPGTLRMSHKGNDLVRGYLWNAARVALVHNPAIRALYRRLKAKGKRGDVAIGHCMRKLLHLVFAVWKTNRPFDEQHFPWEPPSDSPVSTPPVTVPASDSPGPTLPATSVLATASNDEAVGHKAATAAEQVVTTAESSVKPAPAPVNPPPAARPKVDFAFLRQQVTMEQVLRHLGLFDSCAVAACKGAAAVLCTASLGKARRPFRFTWVNSSSSASRPVARCRAMCWTFGPRSGVYRSTKRRWIWQQPFTYPGTEKRNPYQEPVHELNDLRTATVPSSQPTGLDFQWYILFAPQIERLDQHTPSPLPDRVQCVRSVLTTGQLWPRFGFPGV